MQKNEDHDKYGEHWDKIYNKADESKLGWFETDLTPTLDLILKAGIGSHKRVLNVGAGATTLIDILLERGFDNLIATDISAFALEMLKTRIGSLAENVEWIIDDLTKPRLLTEIGLVDVWIDRAVLHFFTEEDDQNTYFRLLRKILHKYGYVIFAEFSHDGADVCSGLPVHQYDVAQYQEKLGAQFKLIDSFNYRYTMPSGDVRPYVYALFQKIA